jgi:hypothetical protein
MFQVRSTHRAIYTHLEYFGYATLRRQPSRQDASLPSYLWSCLAVALRVILISRPLQAAMLWDLVCTHCSVMVRFNRHVRRRSLLFP